MLRLPLPLFSKTAAGAKMIQLFRLLHTFWTDGYFACSVGNVSEEMLKRYIEDQG